MRHKFNAIRTDRQGIKFDSKAEAKYFDQLTLLQKSGQVVFFLRQVGFDLPGKVRYFCDFLVFHADGSCEVIDIKGMDTPISKAKRKMVEDIYPVKIKIIGPS